MSIEGEPLIESVEYLRQWLDEYSFENPEADALYLAVRWAVAHIERLQQDVAVLAAEVDRLQKTVEHCRAERNKEEPK